MAVMVLTPSYPERTLALTAKSWRSFNQLAKLFAMLVQVRETSLSDRRVYMSAGTPGPDQSDASRKCRSHAPNSFISR